MAPQTILVLSEKERAELEEIGNQALAHFQEYRNFLNACWSENMWNQLKEIGSHIGEGFFPEPGPNPYAEAAQAEREAKPEIDEEEAALIIRVENEVLFGSSS